MSKIQYSTLLFLSATSHVFAKTIENSLPSVAKTEIADQEDLLTSLIVSSLIVAVYGIYWLKQKI